MNLYPKYYKQIKIIPKHYLLLDSMDYVRADFTSLLDDLKNDEFKNTTNWLSPYWYESFCGILQNCKRLEINSWTQSEGINLKFRKRFWKKDAFVNNYYWFRDKLERKSSKDLITTAQIKAKWAHNLTDKLFSFRSSLVVALNLAWILKYKTVYLVGVDLNDSKHFHPPYSPQVNQSLLDKFGEQAKDKLAATLWHNSIPPVQFALSPIAKLFQETGRSLYVSNPYSLLARQNHVEFRKIPV